jgi:hypothetical protein
MRGAHIEILFLVFVIILVSSIIYRMSNKALVLALAAAFVAFGIYKADRPACAPSHPPAKVATPVYVSQEPGNSQEPTAAKPDSPPTYATVNEAANQYSARDSDDFETHLYKNLDAAQDEFRDLVCPGDNLLSMRMWENGKRSKTAMDNRAKFDKYSFLHYVDEELRNTSESIWWDDDSLEHLF